MKPKMYRRILRWPIPSWLWKSVNTHCAGFTIQTSWEVVADEVCMVTIVFIDLFPYLQAYDYLTKRKRWFRTHKEMPLLTKLRLWWFWINSTEVRETDDAPGSAEEAADQSPVEGDAQDLRLDG